MLSIDRIDRNSIAVRLLVVALLILFIHESLRAQGGVGGIPAARRPPGAPLQMKQASGNNQP
jgi:hypothetical protein